jgi:predicted negative regulator of RcsB-dependent stress response
MRENLPIIVVELVMVFGGALAFAWWQLRDLKKEKEKSKAKKAAEETRSP